jgi:pimeloyl-ACP methyl ester carboxylesterase
MRGSLLSISTMAAVLLCAGCGGEADPTSTRDPKDFSLPLDYSSDDFWLCRPGLEVDHCLIHDLSATAILPDGSTEEEAHVVAEDPEYDCFYVYPTVDLSGPVGNHTDFDDVQPMLDPLLSQAARFTGQCRVFAPLYRQITIVTYLSGDAEPYLERAYVDVEAAFAHYLANHAGDRSFVIMGHSQGAHLTRRLVQRVIADDPQLRSRMIAALLIGGDMVVADGETTGGFFDDIPLCTEVAETGCILAYRSYAEGYPPTGTSNSTGAGAPAGSVPACTNPADLTGARAHFAATYIPLSAHQSAYDAGELIGGLPFDTAFALYRDLYTGECVEDGEGHPYLEIGVEPLAEDTRENLIPFDAGIFSPSFLGLHVLDFNFALGDLMMLVDAKAAAALP